MKNGGVIICLTVLLVAGLLVTPAIGSANKASQQLITAQKINLGTVTLDFIDCTGAVPVKKEITIYKAEWMSIRNELQAISTTELSIQDSITAQLTVFKNHHLISADITSVSLLSKTNERAELVKLLPFAKRIHSAPIINNSIFNGMCAINFVLKNGTTGVFGLNTFVNLIGFDIISFHKGYAPNGIQSNGLISRSVPPGEYVGVMFGFLGYWLGEKISTGFYSNLTAAGFTIFTAWLPIPLVP